MMFRTNIRKREAPDRHLPLNYVVSMPLLSQTSLDGFGGLLVARFLEESEHVLLVGLYAGLVEGVNTEHVAADAASLLEEVDELAEVVLVEGRDLDLDVWHAAIGMGEESAELSHLVDLVYTLASEVVEAVEVGVVGGDYDLLVGLCNGDAGLEDDALSLLNPLTHRVEVGGEVGASGEDALAVFAFRLAIELFPPLGEIVELRLEVDEDLGALAVAVEYVACGSVYACGVLLEGYGACGSDLHILCALEELLDVETCDGDWEEAYGSEDGETAAYIVWYDKSLVTLLSSERAESALGLVGDGHDAFLGLGFADLLLELLFEETEGYGWLCGGAALRDDDDTEVLALEEFKEVGGVVLADILACVEDDGGLAVGLEVVEAVGEAFDYGTCSEVAAADAYHYNEVAVVAEDFGGGLNLVEEGVGCLAWEVMPTDEVSALAVALVELLESLSDLTLEGFDVY